MEEVFFISPTFIKKYTSLNGSVLEDYFPGNLLVAEDQHVQAYLGDTLYNHLKQLIKDDTIGDVGNEDYKTLIDEYIKYVSLWWFMYEHYEDLYLKIDNGGLVTRVSEDTAQASRNDVTLGKKRAEGRAKYYSQRLINYLCKYSQLYPEYSSWDLICPKRYNYQINISGTPMQDPNPINRIKYG
jgi:hypothetical protein